MTDNNLINYEDLSVAGLNRKIYQINQSIKNWKEAKKRDEDKNIVKGNIDSLQKELKEIEPILKKKKALTFKLPLLSGEEIRLYKSDVKCVHEQENIEGGGRCSSFCKVKYSIFNPIVKTSYREAV